MTTQSSKPILCECIDIKPSVSMIKGSAVYNFVLDLNIIETERILIKFLPCNSTTKDRYTVSSNSDFAKLYRLTLGENPTKRFSEAQHLAGHFLGYKFYAEYKTAESAKNIPYLKVTQLKPEAPCKNDGWTANGTLKKARKKRPKQPPELPDEHRKSTGQLPDFYRINTGQVPDNKTLQPAKTLGLEPVFNPIKKRPLQDKKLKPLDHTPDGEFFFNPEALAFYNDRLDVLLNNFEFEKVEAIELAKDATIREFGDNTTMPYFLGKDLAA